MRRKIISIASSCYNEEGNLWELYDRITAVMAKLPAYDYEFILADNASTDHTADILRSLAQKDSHIKVILNSRNFGAARSGFHVFSQATGDCVIGINADLQEPPELILDFVRKWEEGYKLVLGVKKGTRGNTIAYKIRKIYYKITRSISNLELVDNFLGYGLYDKVVFSIMKQIEWPAPHFRALVSEVGFESAKVEYIQEPRKHGKSSFRSWFSLFDVAMDGVTSFSKVPLRIATLAGGFLSVCSLIVALFYLVIKLTNWGNIPTGIAPLVIGMFFFFSIQILFIGLLGEYVMQILRHVDKKPMVVEKERIGFPKTSEGDNK